jgi:DNA-binding response OmpR family regulator
MLIRVLLAGKPDDRAGGVADGLRGEGMAVDVALHAPAVLEYIMSRSYDVVVLDRDLPGLGGGQVRRALTDAGRRSRVLLLTVPGTLDDLLDGFLRGADDQLTRPFSITELAARVRALACRPYEPGPRRPYEPGQRRPYGSYDRHVLARVRNAASLS